MEAAREYLSKDRATDGGALWRVVGVCLVRGALLVRCDESRLFGFVAGASCGEIESALGAVSGASVVEAWRVAPMV